MLFLYIITIHMFQINVNVISNMFFISTLVPYEPIELSLARTIWAVIQPYLLAIYAVRNSSNHFHIPGDNFKREVCVDDLDS
jgi:hypothetical protein